MVLAVMSAFFKKELFFIFFFLFVFSTSFFAKTNEPIKIDINLNLKFYDGEFDIKDQDKFNYGLSLYLNDNYKKAIDIFKSLVNEKPTGKYSDDAVYYIFKYYLKSNNYKEALETYQILHNLFSDRYYSNLSRRDFIENLLDHKIESFYRLKYLETSYRYYKQPYSCLDALKNDAIFSTQQYFDNNYNNPLESDLENGYIALEESILNEISFKLLTQLIDNSIVNKDSCYNFVIKRSMILEKNEWDIKTRETREYGIPSKHFDFIVYVTVYRKMIIDAKLKDLLIFAGVKILK